MWTGLEEPDGCALLVARGGERRFVLYVRPRDKEKEIWNGKRAGVDGAREIFGADESYPVGEMEARLAAFLDGAPNLWFKVGADAGWDARMARALGELRAGGRLGKHTPGAIVEPGRILHELRLVKGPEEIERLRKAAEITAEAHFAAMRDGLPGRREYQVQAEIEYAFGRRGGNGPGYVVQDEWRDLLEGSIKNASNWYAWLHLKASCSWNISTRKAREPLGRLHSN